MNQRTCVTDGCDRAVQAKGMCTTHYSTWYRANRKKPRTCEWCDETFQTARPEEKFCSRSCAGKNANSHLADSPRWAEYQVRVQAAKLPTREPVSIDAIRANHKAARSNLRAAYEEARWDDFIAALYLRCVKTPEGCWEWQGAKSTPAKSASPYPLQKWSGKRHPVHRLALEAKHGAPLGTQQAHHTCANTMCVNPDHLQAATHVENIAEMKARRSYEARIAELERALELIDARHPLLKRIPYGAA